MVTRGKSLYVSMTERYMSFNQKRCLSGSHSARMLEAVIGRLLLHAVGGLISGAAVKTHSGKFIMFVLPNQ